MAATGNAEVVVEAVVVVGSYGGGTNAQTNRMQVQAVRCTCRLPVKSVIRLRTRKNWRGELADHRYCERGVPRQILRVSSTFRG